MDIRFDVLNIFEKKNTHLIALFMRVAQTDMITCEKKKIICKIEKNETFALFSFKIEQMPLL